MAAGTSCGRARLTPAMPPAAGVSTFWRIGPVPLSLRDFRSVRLNTDATTRARSKQRRLFMAIAPVSMTGKTVCECQTFNVGGGEAGPLTAMPARVRLPPVLSDRPEQRMERIVVAVR